MLFTLAVMNGQSSPACLFRQACSTALAMLYMSSSVRRAIWSSVKPSRLMYARLNRRSGYSEYQSISITFSCPVVRIFSEKHCPYHKFDLHVEIHPYCKQKIVLQRISDGL